MKAAHYRATISLGTDKDGEALVKTCGELAEKLNLRNTRGEPNFSALFRRAIESLAKELSQGQ